MDGYVTLLCIVVVCFEVILFMNGWRKEHRLARWEYKPTKLVVLDGLLLAATVIASVSGIRLLAILLGLS